MTQDHTFWENLGDHMHWSERWSLMRRLWATFTHGGSFPLSERLETWMTLHRLDTHRPQFQHEEWAFLRRSEQR